MKIYTKTGDAGETGLLGAIRVPKDHIRIQSYGTLDELNAILGMILTEAELPKRLNDNLSKIQNELFQLGTELATPREKEVKIPLINEIHIHHLESEMDRMEEDLPPLKNFILPGGTKSGAVLHYARTVSRRAEREIITLHRDEPLRLEVLQYVNRLSDYFFMAARWANQQASQEETPWISPRI
jgi:cob(I)alamin adenosyltransferase